MISYLQIENLTKSYGDRVLFDSVTFGVNQGDKIGLIAKNGTGKSTLLSIISGKETADSGKVTFRSGIRVGYVEQTPGFDPEATVIQACMAADTPASRATRCDRKTAWESWPSTRRSWTPPRPGTMTTA